MMARPGKCRVCGYVVVGTPDQQGLRFWEHWTALHEGTFDERHPDHKPTGGCPGCSSGEAHMCAGKE